MLFRSMLGVRPADPAQPRQAADVSAAIGTDGVAPGEGLSVFNDPATIPFQVQGEVWVIDTQELPPELEAHQRGKKQGHYHLEPSSAVNLDELQALLAGTRDLWKKADGGTTS